MKRLLMVATLGLAAACAQSVEPPSPLYPSYFLATVDGAPLPVAFEGGATLLSSHLVFADPEALMLTGGVSTGMVRYIQRFRLADQTEQASEVQLDYQVAGDELRINLCPPLALCIAQTELVGTITNPTDPLPLTHYLAGQARSVYRYFPALPD